MTELIGASLAALLKERGMSQKELAEAAGLTPASYAPAIALLLCNRAPIEGGVLYTESHMTVSRQRRTP